MMQDQVKGLEYPRQRLEGDSRHTSAASRILDMYDVSQDSFIRVSRTEAITNSCHTSAASRALDMYDMNQTHSYVCKLIHTCVTLCREGLRDEIRDLF